MSEEPILLIGGLSGAGKSTVAHWLATEAGFLELEIDLPEVDGIDFHGLRHEWNEFYRRGKPAPLAETIRTRIRSGGHRGAVLSFPSNAVFSVQQIAIAKTVGIRVAVLFGPPEHCIRAFLDRERAAGQLRDEHRWHTFNDKAYELYRQGDYDSAILDTIRSDGSRRTRDDILDDLRERLAVDLPNHSRRKLAEEEEQKSATSK